MFLGNGHNLPPVEGLHDGKMIMSGVYGVIDPIGSVGYRGMEKASKVYLIPLIALV